MLFRYTMQKLFAPFWYFETIGCKAGNIDAANALINAGFDVSVEADMPAGCPSTLIVRSAHLSHTFWNILMFQRICIPTAGTEFGYKK